MTLHHADLYRLDRTAEVADLALAELAEFDGIVLVEWGDVVEATFGDHLVVHLEHDVDDVDGDDDAGDDADESGADDVAVDRDRRRRPDVGGALGDGSSTAVEAYRC